MEQQPSSDSQELMPFGGVDPSSELLETNNSSGNSSPVLEQEISPNNRPQQVQPTLVNYGPCIRCNINERCVVFIPCAHLACCGQCSTACNDICPVLDCNQPIIERLHVFKS